MDRFLTSSFTGTTPVFCRSLFATPSFTIFSYPADTYAGQSKRCSSTTPWRSVPAPHHRAPLRACLEPALTRQKGAVTTPWFDQTHPGEETAERTLRR